MNMKHIARKLYYMSRIPRDILYCYLSIGFWDPTWIFHGRPLLYRQQNSEMKIGTDWIACSDARRNSIGVFQRVTIKTYSPGSLNIGNNVGMSGVSISCSSSISIGNDVLIGSGALITDSDAHPLLIKNRSDRTKIRTKPIIIEDGVFIGARAIILKGSHLGRGSVIGAGAVVSGNVPSECIFAGNPAKLIRKLDRSQD